MKQRKNKLGFTLVEITTTVAVIGVVSAIAIPNLLRVRVNVNMEMVRQDMKTIHEALNDMRNRDGSFPEDLNQLTSQNDYDPEMSITASLTAIDLKGFTTDGYSPVLNNSNYSMRTCPKRLGVNGDACWYIDPVTRPNKINPWDGSGMPMSPWSVLASTDPDSILSDPNLSADEKAQLLADILEELAYKASLMQAVALQNCHFMGCAAELSDPSSGLFYFNQENQPSFEALLPKIHGLLEELGIHFAQVETNANRILDTNGTSFDMMPVILALHQQSLTQSAFTYLSQNPDSTIIEGSFLLDDPIESFMELQQRLSS